MLTSHTWYEVPNSHQWISPKELLILGNAVSYLKCGISYSSQGSIIGQFCYPEDVDTPTVYF